MAIVKLQSRRSFRNAPSLGKWDIYSAAYFDTATAVPNSTVRDLVTRLFLGQSAGVQNTMGRTNVIVTGANASTVRAWEWTAGALVSLGQWTQSVTANDAAGGALRVNMPPQCSIAVGYRTEVNIPRQRGRSRWWLGPVVLDTANSTDPEALLRLNATGLDQVADNATDCLTALAAQGWNLVVKSGPLLTATFAPAFELYVDDVIDVVRSRRAWQVAQERRLL
jgi:hypothetical protein